MYTLYIVSLHLKFLLHIVLKYNLLYLFFFFFNLRNIYNSIIANYIFCTSIFCEVALNTVTDLATYFLTMRFFRGTGQEFTYGILR